jgi:hypothetical protein
MRFAPAHVLDYRSAAEMIASYAMIRNHFRAIPERVETTPPVRIKPPPRIEPEPAPQAVEPDPPPPEEPEPPPHAGVLVEDIIRAICSEFQLTKTELLSERRSMNVVRPRQIAFSLCKHLTTRSLVEIGRRLGDRDHTTVIHGVRKMAPVLDAAKDGMPEDATPAQWARVMREYVDPQ